jgi:D-serine deaminase-like pyridoxal phosphate-dependent protein
VLTRRGLLAAGAAATAGASLAPAAAGAKPRRFRPPPAPIGTGGEPTPLPEIARLAREVGRGEPVMFVDLAAVDRNIAAVIAWAQANRVAIRPALKVFSCAQLAAYVLQRLPEPRGLMFHLAQLDALVRRLPAGADLLTGYPPTLGELRAHLATAPPRGQRRHRLRILIASVPLLEETARLARSTKRPLPLDVGLELDSGMGRGGFGDATELGAAIALLRRERERLRLTAVLCYDGHATLTGAAEYRKLVAQTAQQKFAGYLAQLTRDAADLHDPAALVRNGPGSSNYRNWAGTTAANEIAPGSAFLYPHYLSSYDHDGLAPALYQCAPVMRITSDSPSVPFTQTTLPGSTREELLIKGGGWPSSGGTQPTLVYPDGLEGDELSGGGNAYTAPKGLLKLGDYVVFQPEQAEEGVAYFEALVAIREGKVRRVWPTLPRWGAPPA